MPILNRKYGVCTPNNVPNRRPSLYTDSSEIESGSIWVFRDDEGKYKEGWNILGL